MAPVKPLRRGAPRKSGDLYSDGSPVGDYFQIYSGEQATAGRFGASYLGDRKGVGRQRTHPHSPAKKAWDPAHSPIDPYTLD